MYTSNNFNSIAYNGVPFFSQKREDDQVKLSFQTIKEFPLLFGYIEQNNVHMKKIP